MQKLIQQKNTGFTLVEMMVSVAIFAMVLTVALGAILTIVDTNKKAQTLSTTMTDMSFAIESMTRTIKTGDPDTLSAASNSVTITDQDDRFVTYSYDSTEKTIYKSIDRSSARIVSELVEIDYANFEVFDIGQPRVFIVIHGTMNLGPRISSEFNIQTSVSPRKLDI